MNKKSLILKSIWGIIGLSWVVLFGLFFTNPDTKSWAIAVTLVAILTEIGVWLFAAFLGLTMWESRKQILIKGLKVFRKG